MYTMISSVPPNGNRPNVSSFFKERTYEVYFVFLRHFSFQFPLGSGADGPIGSMAGMEPHHINGSLGTTDLTDTAQCQT